MAQQPTGQRPSSPDQKSDDSQQPTETLKVNVNVVQLFFNVKDKHGALIPNLTKDDFDIFEDGQKQTVKYFTPETNLPLTLGILIDSSGSQLHVLDMEKEVGGAFLKQVLTDKDLGFVLDFDVDASMIQDYTREVKRLQKALNSVKINSGVTMPTLPGAGGGPVPTAASPGTVLYDAVYLSAHDMLAKEVGRKAMILLTDGQDEGSKLKIKDAIEAAQKADSIVYVLLCADRGGYLSAGMGYHGEGDTRNSLREDWWARHQRGKMSVSCGKLIRPCRRCRASTNWPYAHQHEADGGYRRDQEQAELRSGAGGHYADGSKQD
jgi:VWFA-related protein